MYKLNCWQKKKYLDSRDEQYTIKNSYLRKKIKTLLVWICKKANADLLNSNRKEDLDKNQVNWLVIEILLDKEKLGDINQDQEDYR